MSVAFGVALSGIAVLVGVALAIRPALGSTWPSSASVFGSLVPVGIVGLTIGGLFGSVGALNTPSARRRRRILAGLPPSWPCHRP